MEHASAKITEKSERKPIKLPIKALLIGGGIGTVLFFILLVASAAVLLSMGIKASLLPYISVVIGGLSSFVASFIASKSAGEKGMLIGIGCAVIELLALCAVLIVAANGLGIAAVFLCVAVIASGGAGGVFGVNSTRSD